MISNQNIVFSLLVLSVLIPSTLLGVVTIVVAVIAHEASELIAVANGLRVVRAVAPEYSSFAASGEDDAPTTDCGRSGSLVFEMIQNPR